MARVKVTKLTDVNLLRLANSFTSGKESKMSLAKAYAYRHSPIRTQLFAIEMNDIPLFVASQLVRSHVGVQWYQRSKRTDRGGEDFSQVCHTHYKIIDAQCDNIEDLVEDEIISNDDSSIKDSLSNLRATADAIVDLPSRFDRNAPTDLLGVLNAEAIINISHKRFCSKASHRTRLLWSHVVCEIRNIDPDLANHCVAQCIYCGFCSEPKGCGWIKSPAGIAKRNDYLKLYE